MMIFARDNAFYRWWWYKISAFMALCIVCLVPRQFPVVSDKTQASDRKAWREKRNLQRGLHSFPVLLHPLIAPFYVLVAMFQAYRPIPKSQRNVFLRIAHVLFCMIGVFTNFLMHVIWDWLLFLISFPVFIYIRRKSLFFVTKLVAFILYIFTLVVTAILALEFGDTAPVGFGIVFHAVAVVLGAPLVAFVQFCMQKPVIGFIALAAFIAGIAVSLIVFGWQKKDKGQGIDAAISEIKEHGQLKNIAGKSILRNRDERALLETLNMHYLIYVNLFSFDQAMEMKTLLKTCTSTSLIPLGSHDICVHKTINTTEFDQWQKKTDSIKYMKIYEIQKQKKRKGSHQTSLLGSSSNVSNQYGTMSNNVGLYTIDEESEIKDEKEPIYSTIKL